MSIIRPLSGIEKPNVSELGGKGYSLAFLLNNQFNVPKGFIITSDVFFDYLTQNDQLGKIKKIISEIDENNFKKKSYEIKNLVLNGKIQEEIALQIKNNLKKLNVQFVSIRSSAGSEDGLKSSFAGLHDTFLNIKLDLNLILENVKRCWSSLFNAKSIYYRIKKGMPILEGMAVIIQEMIPAEVSGILLTIHPFYKRNMLIEMSYGIGDLIVSGKIQPDSCVIERETFKILEKKLGNQNNIIPIENGKNNAIKVPKEFLKRQVISDEKIKEIARICMEIEKTFKYPQDIEWCIYKNKVWVLQSRAITKIYSSLLEESKKKEIIVKGFGASRGIANGPVKIIVNIQQWDKLKESDVLVTKMTTPDMVLLMGKAIAIVTDVGGMCCHAALISRELEIPCVVGTGNATNILKDNTLVEVDGIKGVIYKYKEEEIEMSKKTSSTKFKIFGHETNPVVLKMNRDEPLCPQNWDCNWPAIDMSQDYEWIAPRPEITGDPIGSLIISGIEKIPYIFGFNDIGPLYVRFYNATQYLRLDKIEKIMSSLQDHIENRNVSFINKYKEGLFHSYEELKKISNEIEKKHQIFEKMKSESLLETFKTWWKAEDNFFAHTYLIQAIGDDIVWPKVREILTNYFNQNEVDEYFSLLSIPTTKIVSMEFFEDCLIFINKYKTIKPLIFTRLSEKETINIINNMKEGDEWLKDLKELTKKWGWIRTRLFYHEPISEIEKMLRNLKLQSSREAILPDIKKHSYNFNNSVEKIRSFLSKESFDELLFFIDLGKFLARERDNHFYIFLKESKIIRDLFIELGKRLKEQNLLYDLRDIFFLFIQEIFKLFSSKIPIKDKEEIISKIPNRMNAFTYISKFNLHNRPEYNCETTPNRDGEYY